jgi:hypothetical protein
MKMRILIFQATAHRSAKHVSFCRECDEWNDTLTDGRNSWGVELDIVTNGCYLLQRAWPTVKNNKTSPWQAYFLKIQ